MELLERLKGGLIVSCQAREGWPMYGEAIMAAFASAAKLGNAVGIRANRPENIRAIKQAVDLPVIGIYKDWVNGYDVYITPTLKSALQVAETGAEIIAIDGTKRQRPGNESVEDIVNGIKKHYPNTLVMADIATKEEGIYAEACGVDLVATTLSGHTAETKHVDHFNDDLIKQLAMTLKIPVIAEGKIHSPEEAVRALDCGAHAVVVGTAITRPEIITSWYSDALKRRQP